MLQQYLKYKISDTAEETPQACTEDMTIHCTRKRKRIHPNAIWRMALYACPPRLSLFCATVLKTIQLTNYKMFSETDRK